mmetsp:Transcript_78601/g.173480  ORF Transcript_78601/g.173480 Transcript_78601/m.173480 type:complete len:98 (+) Transcript_78601:238-531(+)
MGAATQLLHVPRLLVAVTDSQPVADALPLTQQPVAGVGAHGQLCRSGCAATAPLLHFQHAQMPWLWVHKMRGASNPTCVRLFMCVGATWCVADAFHV